MKAAYATPDRDRSDHQPLPPFEPGIYRHYKGAFYFAQGLAWREIDMEPMVIYGPLGRSDVLYVRTLARWTDRQCWPGHDSPCSRFERQAGDLAFHQAVAKTFTDHAGVLRRLAEGP